MVRISTNEENIVLTFPENESVDSTIVKSRVLAVPGASVHRSTRIEDRNLNDIFFRKTIGAMVAVKYALIGSGRHQMSPEAAQLYQATVTLNDMQELWHAPTTPLPVPSILGKMTPWSHQLRAYNFIRSVFDTSKDVYNRLGLPVYGGVLLEMAAGTGKSYPIILTILNNHPKFKTSTPISRVTIVTPKATCKTVWVDYIKALAPDDLMPEIVMLTDNKRSMNQDVYFALLQIKKAEAEGRQVIVIVNYERFWQTPIGPKFVAMKTESGKPYQEMVENGFLVDFKADLQIYDESHKLKKNTGVWSKMAYLIRQSSPFVILATGTLAPHSPPDVFAQLRLLDPGLFGDSFTGFKSRHCEFDGHHKFAKIVDYKNIEELNYKRKQFTFQCSDSELDLPDFHEVPRYFEMHAEERKFYNQVATQMLAKIVPAQAEMGQVEIEGDYLQAWKFRVEQLGREARELPHLMPEYQSQLADYRLRMKQYEEDHKRLTAIVGPKAMNIVKLRLRQISSGFCVADKDENDEEALKSKSAGEVFWISKTPSKLAMIEEELDNLREKAKIVVFCVFKASMDKIGEACERLGMSYGFLRGGKSDHERWLKGTDLQVLIVQIQSGNAGIDMRVATDLIFYERSHNMGDYEQAKARSRRGGQTKEGKYFLVMAQDSVEQSIHTALRDKVDVNLRVLGDMKGKYQL